MYKALLEAPQRLLRMGGDQPEMYGRSSCDLRRIARFVEGNPVNDRVILWVRPDTYDLAAQVLSDSPTGNVLLGDRIDEASFAKGCMSPLNKCSHRFPSKPLPVGAFSDPKAQLWRIRIRIFKRSHAKAICVVEPPNDKREGVRFWSLHSALASRHVLVP